MMEAREAATMLKATRKVRLDREEESIARLIIEAIKVDKNFFSICNLARETLVTLTVKGFHVSTAETMTDRDGSKSETYTITF